MKAPNVDDSVFEAAGIARVSLMEIGSAIATMEKAAILRDEKAFEAAKKEVTHHLINVRDALSKTHFDPAENDRERYNRSMDLAANTTASWPAWKRQVAGVPDQSEQIIKRRKKKK